jgi:2-oxo-3-hexenedioate decarboxylase
MNLDAAYDEQDQLVEARLARGESIVGAKVAMTTRARQRHYGIDGPIFGWLTDAMQLPFDDPLVVSDYARPRVEPEIVFVMGAPLPAGPVTAAAVLACASAVYAGLEIADSALDLASATVTDIVAANSAASGFMVGRRGIPPLQRDLTTLGCLLEVNGDVVDTATGAALMGHPAEGVARLANHLRRRGRTIEPGWIILAGSLTDAVPVAAGDQITATYAHLGSVTLRAV